MLLQTTMKTLPAPGMCKDGARSDAINLCRALALAASCILAAPNAGAWGNMGHEAIALVAWNELSPAQQTEVNDIFAGAPSIYGSKQGVDALIFAATWPDVLREGHEHGSLNVPLHIFESIGATSSNAKAVDNLHFADFDPATDSPALPADNVATGVNLAFQFLKDKSSTPLQKGEALSYLIHCVGDAHQPLHSGFTNDLGGNDITIHPLKGEKNLHAAWDTGFFATTPYFVKGSTPPTDFVSKILDPLVPSVKAEALATLNPSDWVNESHKLAQQSAYVDENGQKIVSGATLSSAYVSSRLTIAEKRLAEGGVRLAALLGQALP